MQKFIPVDALKRVIKDRLILDVRREADFNSSTIRIPGSVWLNPEDITDWSEELPKSSDIVIYCVRGGSVSNSVVDFLRAKGFSVNYIEGGIEAWQAGGGETEQKP